MNMDSLEGDGDRMYMQSWNFWKASDWFFEDTTSGRLSYLLFLFCLFLFYHILRKWSALHYFNSGEVDARTQIRVLPGGYIIFQYHLILLQYHHIFSFNFLNRDDGLFPHRAIRCSLDECRKRRPGGYLMTGQRVQWTWILRRETVIECTWSLGISEKLQIDFLKTQLPGGCLICCSFFVSSFSIIFSENGLHCTTLTAVR